MEAEEAGRTKLVICSDGTASVAKIISRVNIAKVKAMELIGDYGLAAELAAANGVDPS
jgi:hypothetical protein